MVNVGELPKIVKISSKSTKRSLGGKARSIPIGATVPYGDKTYTWTNNAWRSGTEVLRGDDAREATSTFKEKR
jgi:hypothetical protein